jgi:hypothetical protein
VALWSTWILVSYILAGFGFISAFICWSLGGTLTVIISYAVQLILNPKNRDLQNGVVILFLLPMSMTTAWIAPQWVELLYSSLLSTIGPLLLLLQAVFVVRLIVRSSDYLIEFIEEKPTLVKVFFFLIRNDNVEE